MSAENPDLEVVKADTPDTWIHGLMSMPVESKTARNIRPLDSGSVLRIVTFTHQPGSARVSWSSVPGRIYQV